MTAQVFHLALDPRDNPLAMSVTPDQVAAMLRAVGTGSSGSSAVPWAIKVPVSPPGVPAWIRPEWIVEARNALGCGSGSFCCDTVSITTRGLEEPDLLREQASRQGLGSRELPFVVADEDGACPSPLAQAEALAVLNSLRPHPHLGFYGALADLGLGLVPRQRKLDLHCDIRPSVDTPLCAGCGSCLDVCLYDAIKIQAGRAFIDHKDCTGCGECMTVCFMAGISPEENTGVEVFQHAVAHSAAEVLAGFASGALFVNFLVGLDRFTAGPGRRMPLTLNRGHLLAGHDPVAVDQATWDMLREACAGNLKNWHGYPQDPEILLAEAQVLGLGSRNYQLSAV